MYQIEKSCCFTGHRDIPREKYPEISELVRTAVLHLYDEGVRHFIAGGAVGFDMISAVTLLNLRSERPGLTLTLALPCRDHDRSWTQSDRSLLATLRRHADSEVFVSESYDRECMFRRNRYMVDMSAYCISYCRKRSGGSYYTECYARKNGKTVIPIDPGF